MTYHDPRGNNPGTRAYTQPAQPPMYPRESHEVSRITQHPYPHPHPNPRPLPRRRAHRSSGRPTSIR